MSQNESSIRTALILLGLCRFRIRATFDCFDSKFIDVSNNISEKSFF
jgi:hypothetical protein